MKKKLYVLFLLLFISSFSLTGCFFVIGVFFDDDSNSSPKECSNIINPTDPIENSTTDSIQNTTVNTLAQLTILLDFQDQPLQTSQSDWSDLYFNPTKKSVAKYYNDVSYGHLNIIPAQESYDLANDGIIIIHVNNIHPNLNSLAREEDFNDFDYILSDILADASTYIDFSSYDTDYDNYISNTELSVAFIFAGYEECEYYTYSNETSGVMIDYPIYIDQTDLALQQYIFAGELSFNVYGETDIASIGTICHETGHILGLPDLYDTSYQSIGLGFHSLMSEGNNNSLYGEFSGSTPSPLIAWCKEYLGYVTPSIVNNDGEFLLYGQSTDTYNIIKINEGNGYYLIENIDFGNWGAGIEPFLTNSGIAIWYINTDVVTTTAISKNEINNIIDNRGIDLIEAGGTYDLYNELLDYERTDYTHYFAVGYDDQYITNNGTIITILDEPSNQMRIYIDFY